jgi:4-amino-4-deoxy-L-arabinose transferase-like glycosyltransferase
MSNTTDKTDIPNQQQDSKHYLKDLSPKAFYISIVMVFIAAVLIRASLLYELKDELNDSGYLNINGTDMATYVEIARTVTKGSLFAKNPTISPLAPLVTIPLFLILSGDSLPIAMLLQVLMSGFSIVLFMFITREMINSKGAAIAGIFAALYSPFIIYSIIPLTEETINFFFLLTLYSSILLLKKPSLLRFVFLGSALGLATVSKPTMIILLPVLYIIFIASYKNKIRQYIKGLTAAAVIAFLIISPFIWRAYKLSGEWLFMRGNTSYMMLMGNNPNADGTYNDNFPDDYKVELAKAGSSLRKLDSISTRLSFRFWRNNPANAVKLFAKKIILFFSPNELANNASITYLKQTTILGTFWLIGSAIIFPFSLIGLFIALKDFSKWKIPLTFAIVYAFLIINTIILTRLRLPVVWVMIMLAANSILWLNEIRCAKEKQFKFLSILFVLLILIAYGKKDELWHSYGPHLHKNGFQINKQDMKIYSDGAWKVTFPYRLQLTTESDYIQKVIRIPSDDSLLKVERHTVSIAFKGSVHDSGTVIAEINGI